MLKEFKEFIARGNVVDLAVAVVIGAAFAKIVTSFVDGILMPPIGMLLGSVDFANLYYPLSSKVAAGLTLVEARKLGPVLAYGQFLSDVISFLIVASVVFLMVKAINRVKRPAEEPAPAGPSNDEILLTEIRDLLKAGKS
ncbi:MAG: large conductance mechanosensitive channel protein MscL [Pyrinomonadaceae bacterium]